MDLIIYQNIKDHILLDIRYDKNTKIHVRKIGSNIFNICILYLVPNPDIFIFRELPIF